MTIATCPCGASIVWAVTGSGSRMPFDATPTPYGTWELEPVGAEIRAIYRRTEYVAEALTRGALFYTSHFASCPDAAKYRRRKE